MKRWLIIATLGIWFLCGCQAASDYTLAVSDPVTAQQVYDAQTTAANITTSLISLLPVAEATHPIALLVGTAASLLAGVWIGRQKRKQKEG